uniref:Uncharacterized protein n=1 Tax=Panagrolaimus davidi TaxID=227884 RepID=A0A914R714_9BILA
MGCSQSHFFGFKEFHEKEVGINDNELKKVSYEPQPSDVFDDLDTDNDQKGKVAVDHIFRPTREVYGQPAKDLNDYLIDWAAEYKISLKNRPSPSDFPAFAHEKQQEERKVTTQEFLLSLEPVKK